jgi:PTS system mannose-specific IIA component
MIGKLILTHGGLARELLAAAQRISGELPGFAALSLDWDDSPEAGREKVEAALISLDQGEGVLILTDMFGGTPCNIAAAFMNYGRVEVLTGVNLPMVLRLTCPGLEGKPLEELAHWLRAKGQSSICLASEILPPKECGVT